MMNKCFVGLFYLRSVNGFYGFNGICEEGGSVCPRCGQDRYMKEILFFRKSQFRNVCFLCCDFKNVAAFDIRHVIKR